MIGPTYETGWPIFTPDPVNRQHSLNQGRLAWWLFLPQLMGGRQLFDLMGLFPGTITSQTSGTKWGPTSRTGGYGQFTTGASADGAYVDIVGSGSLLSFTTGFSLGCWFYQTFQSSIQSLMSKYLQSGDNAYDLRLNGSAVELGAASSFSGGSVSVNKWYSVLATVDTGGSGILYLNGVNVATGTPSVSAATSRDLHLGNGFNNTRIFVGAIDDLSIWNRPLSASEAMAWHLEGYLGYPNTLNRLSFSDFAGKRIPLLFSPIVAYVDQRPYIAIEAY